MKHFLLQFKPYCIIAEKQPIPTNDRKGRHINESVHLKLMRFTKPPRENNIRHLSWFSYALDIMIKHLLQPTATQVTWRTCREKPSQKEKQGGRHCTVEVPVTSYECCYTQIICWPVVSFKNWPCNYLKLPKNSNQDLLSSSTRSNQSENFPQNWWPGRNIAWNVSSGSKYTNLAPCKTQEVLQ